MVVFGRWPLWAVVAVLATALLVSAGSYVLAAAVVLIVVICAIYSRRGS
jgi:hypothetical protein